MRSKIVVKYLAGDRYRPNDPKDDTRPFRDPSHYITIPTLVKNKKTAVAIAKCVATKLQHPALSPFPTQRLNRSSPTGALQYQRKCRHRVGMSVPGQLHQRRFPWSAPARCVGDQEDPRVLPKDRTENLKGAARRSMGDSQRQKVSYFV